MVEREWIDRCEEHSAADVRRVQFSSSAGEVSAVLRAIADYIDTRNIDIDDIEAINIDPYMRAARGVVYLREWCAWDGTSMHELNEAIKAAKAWKGTK